MKIGNNISEIRAEMLLNYLYPELEKKWTARCEGTFYRNYNRDSMDINVADAEVSLARDGFLRLLPQGLITSDEDLKKGDIAEKYEELKRRKHLLSEVFLPFDSYVFKNKLSIERKASELLEDKLAYVLMAYFDYDIKQETNPLVRDAAVLLPYVSTWRGDFGFISNLLGTLLKCEVTMTIGRYSHLDTTKCWLPKVRYELFIPGLSPEEYRQKDVDMQPLRDFIIEWFIPFDVVCQIVMKDRPSSQHHASRLTLGYNTEMK